MGQCHWVISGIREATGGKNDRDGVVLNMEKVVDKVK